ncbi:hypothetical protein B0H14DRAFT_904321 [Mycena olivaceomarginata]|nr:hypothetical protein B0H14DRAFT_904321 [Mycena olivaceomarginata]
MCVVRWRVQSSCIPAPPRASLRGAAAPLLALSPWTTRILVSLRVRLGTACLRCEPTLRASFSIIFFGVVQSGIHESVPTAILAVFSHTPRSQCTCDLGTRSHNRYASDFLASLLHSLTGAARSPLNRNSSKYVQHRIRALEPTPLEACSSTISLAMCEMLSAALRTIRSLSGHPARAHHVRISGSGALKTREGVSSHSRPSSATPSSIQQSRASSDASDAFSALSTPAPPERSRRRAPRPARPLAARRTI